MTTTFKAAIFDLDGTLLDSIGDLSASMNETLASYGFPTFPLPFHKSAVGNGVRAYAEKCVPEEKNTPEFLDEFVAKMGARYDKNCTKHTAPFPGILPLLDFLKQQNIVLNVLSNKVDSFAKNMIYHFFKDYDFQNVFGERPGVPKKPAPDAALAIASACGANPSEVLFIGDSIYDVLTGHNAGMISVAASWGYQSEDMLIEKKPDFVAHTPLDIIDYLKDRS